MSLLRTAQTQEAYEIWKQEHPPDSPACALCARKPKTIWKDLWKIIANDFPYDAIASESDLLIPIRHIPNKPDLTAQEYTALNELYEKMNNSPFLGYDAILENFSHGRTQKGHYHVHLLAFKNHAILPANR